MMYQCAFPDLSDSAPCECTPDRETAAANRDFQILLAFTEGLPTHQPALTRHPDHE